VPAPALAAVDVAGAPQAWEQLGFAIDGAEIRIGATTLRIGAADAGIAGWTLAGQGEGDVDGLLTRWIAAAGPPDTPPAHPNGALLVDHVVVATPDLERTLAALADVGLALRRTREAGTPERPLHQAFFRMGEVILEVVGPPQPAGDEPARFWGLVVVVADLDACAVRLGADLGAPRDAVQPGRRIATVRSTSGVSVPLALMTPDPRHRSRSPPPTAG
jgi:hypothetical protein